MRQGAACGLAGKRRASCSRQKPPEISNGKSAESGSLNRSFHAEMLLWAWGLALS